MDTTYNQVAAGEKKRGTDNPCRWWNVYS